MSLTEICERCTKWPPICAQVLARFCNLQHTRGLDSDIPLFCSTKGVAPTAANGYEEIHSVVTALPPFIMEDCSRSYGRRVLEVSFNVATLNDLDGLRLPPHFHYGVGMDLLFKEMMLEHVRGLYSSGHKISQAFSRLARQFQYLH